MVGFAAKRSGIGPREVPWRSAGDCARGPSTTMVVRHNAAYDFPGLQSQRAAVHPASRPGQSACLRQENEREFLQGVHFGPPLAAKDRGLE